MTGHEQMVGQEPMGKHSFDERGRFVTQDYAASRPFASFLPGIAGPLGIPMWVFYVNRGQAIASFGIESKDSPIMEFQPANRAYQTTPYTGFRTFLKLKRGDEMVMYEPFSPWHSADASKMFIGMNELELQTTSAAYGIGTNILYFTLPGEHFAGLVRQVTVTNVGEAPVALEMVDGMPRVIPYGVSNRNLKEIGRTIEAWMEVFHLQQGIPFYRLGASAGDTAEVEEIQAGNFYLAFTAEAGQSQLLPAFVDPVVIFGQNTTLSAPDHFAERSLTELQRRRQITVGRTPCGLFGTRAALEPAESLTVYGIIGHVGNLGQLQRERNRIASADYLHEKRDEAQLLARELTDAVDTRTGSFTFDAYCRQTFLDNVLRGGWPLILGGGDRPAVYHVYSRKHGDLERDYNDFRIAAEMFSQGNGNYRDMNQNWRCDVLLNPRVGDFDVLAFLGLIQADGYNPLVVNGSRFTVSAENRAPILALVEEPDKLASVLAQPFTPGQLLSTITQQEIGLMVGAEGFISTALIHAVQHFAATHGEGYWIDHWTHNLDLIDTYLAVYPDKTDDLLFGKPTVPYFDSPAVVQPRARKYVLVGDKVRQYGAVVEDEEKAALIASRTQTPNLMRTAHGQGEVYRTTVFARLLCLALIKFATLDPLGMGIEMEAGKPGWYDALNGLPGLFGSSLAETYELERLLTLLLGTMAGKEDQTVKLPTEQMSFLRQVVQVLEAWQHSADTDRDYAYWDTVAAARETFRQRVRLGFDGQTASLAFSELVPILAAFRSKVQAGIQRALAMNDGIPPTYFAYSVTDYELITDAEGNPQCDERGRSYVKAKRFEPSVLPLFLEGPVHALKVQPDVTSARRLHAQVRASDLFDRKLKMYKVNASLADQSHEIGRARAFTPGWLENESIWLHMEYKYLLEVLRAGLYGEFFQDFKQVLVPFQDPRVYGRSPSENCSFIVSSAHPDESIHGAGFVARLTGTTAEFLSMWSVMMAGERPFFVQDGQLHLALRPKLPGWLFTEDGEITFSFLGSSSVTYRNPRKLDTFEAGVKSQRIVLRTDTKHRVELRADVIGPPYAAMVRDGQVKSIDVFF
jgi:hypothetical protein